MKIGSKLFDLKNKTYVMGILNVTPDSFSDGGNYTTIENAIMQAKKIVEEGADIIDIGGESTRPGHEQVTLQEEIRRVVPVIKELSKVVDIPISIDTSKALVAEAAIEAGASLINDVWGFKSDPDMAKVAAKYNVPCCLMHNRKNKDYKDMIQDMIKDFQESIDIALEAGVQKENIILDPGIGFAKTVKDNLIVMNHLENFLVLGYPILLGTSRKSMIGKILDVPVDQRVEGTLATTVMGVMKGCHIIRVHDVKENVRAIRMTEAVLNSGE